MPSLCFRWRCVDRTHDWCCPCEGLKSSWSLGLGLMVVAVAVVVVVVAVIIRAPAADF